MICEENWDIAPFGSKHAWVEVDNIPDHCARCGKKYIEYSKQMLDKMLEAHEEEAKQMQAEEDLEKVGYSDIATDPQDITNEKAI